MVPIGSTDDDHGTAGRAGPGWGARGTGTAPTVRMTATTSSRRCPKTSQRRRAFRSVLQWVSVKFSDTHLPNRASGFGPARPHAGSLQRSRALATARHQAAPGRPRSITTTITPDTQHRAPPAAPGSGDRFPGAGFLAARPRSGSGSRSRVAMLGRWRSLPS